VIPLQTIEAHARLSHVRSLISRTARTLVTTHPHEDAFRKAQDEMRAWLAAEAHAITELADALEQEKEP
jgi:hypothetical protein